MGRKKRKNCSKFYLIVKSSGSVLASASFSSSSSRPGDTPELLGLLLTAANWLCNAKGFCWRAAKNGGKTLIGNVDRNLRSANIKVIWLPCIINFYKLKIFRKMKQSQTMEAIFTIKSKANEKLSFKRELKINGM